MYHEQSRALQDRFDSRRIADRLAEKLLRHEFSAEHRAFIGEHNFSFSPPPTRRAGPSARTRAAHPASCAWSNGGAAVHLEDELKAEWPGAQAVVRVRAERIFPNGPRYIHRMALVEASPYVPVAGRPPPVPGWKRNPAFKDYLLRNG